MTTSANSLTADQLLNARDQTVAQVKWARAYTLQLLDATPTELWFEQPEGTPTHIAWQVGHLAVSQYGLMLFRQRGRNPGDLELMPGWLRKQYGRGTVPPQPTDKSPSADDLLARLSAIHEQALKETETLTAETLAQETEMPYACYPIKLGALLFCPIHEGIHAGQIGLIRRSLGLPPVR